MYPFSEGPGSDLDPVFAYIRETEPVCPVRMPYGGDGLIVTRYEDVRAILSDRRFSRAAACGPDVPRMCPEPDSPELILMTDPPEHGRLRRLLAKAFSSRRIHELRPRVTALVENLVSAMIEAGPPVDVVTALALPMPILTICELLGVPSEDRAIFRKWVDPILSTSAYTPQEVRDAFDAFSDYICDLLDARRDKPGDDVLTALIHAHDEEGRLSELELVTTVGTLLVAGHENTANQIANSLFALLDVPERWSALDDLNLDVAVEELIRYLSVGAGISTARVATTDVVIADQVVHAGEAVLVSLPTANRDPRVFADPETLDLRRTANPHLAFGPGEHHCLGAPLARMEVREALDVLRRRLPGLRLAVPAREVTWKSGLLARAPEALPISW